MKDRDSLSLWPAASLAAFLLLALWRNRGIVRYLAGAQPWGPDSAREFLASSLLPLAGVGLWILLLGGLGAVLLRAFKSGGEEHGAATALALGTGAAALAAFWTGWFRLWPQGLWAAGFAACAGAFALKRPRMEALAALLPATLLEALFASAALWWGFHLLLNAWAPPVGWDALAYHLAIPRIYLDSGGLADIPWLPQSRWPHLMEALYAFPMSLGADWGGAMLHAALSAALAVCVYREGEARGGRGAGAMGALLLMSQPALLEVGPQAHSDGALTLFYFLACVHLMRWDREREGSALVVAGLLSGLAAAVKIQGSLLSAALGVFVLLRGGRWAGARFAFWAALPALPWFLRTWALAGNPVWPFASGVFGGVDDPAWFVSMQLRNSLWGFPRDLPLLSRYGPQYLLLPAALAALAAGFRSPGMDPLSKLLLGPAAILAFFALPTHEAWRYLMPAYPALCLLAGSWAASLWRQGGPRRLAAAAGVLWGTQPLWGLAQGNEVFAVSGARSSLMPGMPSRRVYQERQLPFFGFFERAARAAGPGAKVLLFQEVRGYPLRAAYEWGDPLSNGTIPYRRLSGPEELSCLLAGKGFTHVLVNSGNIAYAPRPDYYDARVMGLMGGVLSRARPVLEDGPLSLHALGLTPPCGYGNPPGP